MKPLMEKDSTKTTESNNWLEERIASEPDIIAAREYGIDIGLLYSTLQKSYTERIECHQRALETFHKLYRAGLK